MNTALWVITDGKNPERLQRMIDSCGKPINVLCWSGEKIRPDNAEVFTPELLPCPIAHDTWFTANFNRILWSELLKAEADAVMVMNDDIEWEAGALDKLLKAAESTDYNWAHIQPVQVEFDNPHTVIMGGTGRAYPGGAHITGDRSEIMRDELDRWRWLPFCAPLLNLNAIRAVGMLDPQLKMWFSDSDWCIRARYMGLETLLARNCAIKHINHATAQAGKAAQRFYGDQIAFARKWGGEILQDYSV